MRQFRTDRHAIQRPAIGRIEMDLFQLRPVDLPAILQTARTPADKELLAELLASSTTDNRKCLAVVTSSDREEHVANARDSVLTAG